MKADAIQFYAGHPIQFVRSLIGVEPDELQCEILDSVVHNKMTSVRSGHGVGKTATLSWLICWFLMTHPHARIPCTAPTQPTLRDVLWSELAKWINRSPFLRSHLRWSKERVSLRGHEDDWYAVARTASTPEALQGFHAKHLMYIIDEASGVPDSVFHPVLGSLSTSGSRLVMCANPTQLSGFFFESHHKARGSYNCIVADGRKSSRVSPAYIQQVIDMFGEDSNVFRVRVAGEFPLEQDDVFIPLYLLENSTLIPRYPITQPQTIDVAVDVARFGGDKTVIGYKVDKEVSFYRKISGQDTMRTIGETLELAEWLVKKYHFENEIVPVKIDAGGMGGPVIDRLREIQDDEPTRFRWMSVQPVYFGMHIKNRQFDDTTSFMLGIVRDMLRNKNEDGSTREPDLILPKDDELIAQLSARKYRITSNSRIRVESKEDMRKRGLHSPDEADCLCMLCLPFDREEAKRERSFNE